MTKTFQAIEDINKYRQTPNSVAWSFIFPHLGTIQKALKILWMVECGYIHIHTDKMAPKEIRDFIYLYRKTELLR